MVTEYEQMSSPRTVARVRAVSRDGLRTFLELANGRFATVYACEPLRLQRGAIVLVQEDENHLEVAPDELWPRSPWVGVVRLKLKDVTVVDSSGLLKIVDTNPAVECREGNTVEGDETNGIVRVLSKDPIRRIDLPALNESDILKFEQQRRAGEDTFDDFGGLSQVVDRARELIETPLRFGENLKKINARPIKGVLFTGPPGTGKTMLARIIANSTDSVFYEVSGPEVFSKWYGQSPEILRMLFDRAAKQERAIIFFDEIDSVAGRRADESHEESRRVVAQLLTLMDGFDSDDHVVVIAATNRPQDIDAALRRPGRFDWEIHFPLPDLPDREGILRASARRIALCGEFPYEVIASQTKGWSAAELAAIWREAAMLAAKDNRCAVIAEDFVWGHSRVAEQRRSITRDSSRGGAG
jgi:transitional endoplasmic reticulum ATPase